MFLIKRNQFLVLILMLYSFQGFNQELFKDTVRISLKDAENVFLKKNLTLLAEKYNIDAAKAQIIQNRVWDNPTFSINQNAVNTEYQTNGGKHYFDMTNTGETSAQIQQLFLIAGKRNKKVQISQLSAQKEEYNYYDMLRTLKYTLRSDYYTIYYLQQTLNVYKKEITSLTKLINVFEAQSEKGYVSKKEVLRLKATLFTLENEKLGYITQLQNNLADFNVLLQTTNTFYITMPEDLTKNFSSASSLNLQALLDTALLNRTDLLMAQSDIDINEMNYKYQKSLAVPDLTLSAGWDRNGSFIHNYNYIGLQFDLPFFNRNQGNIKTAKYTIESSKLKVQSVKDRVKADVIQAYSVALENEALYKKFDAKFAYDMEQLSEEMLKNFEKKNISMLEFLDFYDAYKQNLIQFNNLQNNRLNAFENLNFTTGKDILN
jgi:outer membrane protein, heavy metal efflux system